MKRVDYSKIAKRFDKNRRELARPDPGLEQFLKTHSKPQFSVLDIGCGTGNYLETQVEYFKDYNMEWFGLEPSKDMLRIAREKVTGVTLVEGYAQALPFQPCRFDFIITAFTFHHFVDKPRALDEMERVLSDGGMLKFDNIAPEKMPGWIYYRYFPATYTEDLVRFWKTDRLQEELNRRGLKACVDIHLRKSEEKLSEALASFKNRDASQLWTISEEEYHKGIAIVESELQKNPEATFSDEMALITCIARKG